jgi:acetyl-CoA acetyltransferase
VSPHPFHDVAVVAGSNTVQAKSLPGHSSLSIALEAAQLVLDQAGVPVSAVDGIFGEFSGDLVFHLGLGPVWQTRAIGGISNVLMAASLIATGVCEVVLIAEGGAGVYVDPASTAPWTRPENEFTGPFGMYTAGEFAMFARRHMEMFGTTSDQLALVAATIRNNGHVNPDAIYHGRGPFTPEDILRSPMVADPFHLLDCAMTSEGGTALLLMAADRAADVRTVPAYIWGGEVDRFGPGYKYAPVWDRAGSLDEIPAGYVGRRAARRALATGGLHHDDIDACELYDPFSFEIIRQYEAFEFCADGEGGGFVEDGTIALDGRYPTTTDGGTMSFSHGGGGVQQIQRVVRGLHQIQGRCASAQLASPEIVLCSNGGSGALYCEVLLLGRERP